MVKKDLWGELNYEDRFDVKNDNCEAGASGY